MTTLPFSAAIPTTSPSLESPLVPVPSARLWLLPWPKAFSAAPSAKVVPCSVPIENRAPKPEKIGLEFAKSAFGTGSLAALRAIPASQLLEAAAKEGAPKFPADIDGYFLPEAPEAIFRAGKQNDVPLLAGWNLDEGHYEDIFEKEAPTPKNFAATVRKLYGARADTILKLYPAANVAKLSVPHPILPATVSSLSKLGSGSNRNSEPATLPSTAIVSMRLFLFRPMLLPAPNPPHHTLPKSSLSSRSCLRKTSRGARRTRKLHSSWVPTDEFRQNWRSQWRRPAELAPICTQEI